MTRQIIDSIYYAVYLFIHMNIWRASSETRLYNMSELQICEQIERYINCYNNIMIRLF